MNYKNLWRVAVMAMALLGLASASANTDMRDWQMASGETLHSELVKYDLDRKVALLRLENGTESEYPLAAFSAVDQAWLIEWAEFSDELDQNLQHMEGTFSHHQARGAFITDYYVYAPSRYAETTDLPMLILLHPGGKGARFVKQFMEAAELLDILVVSTDGDRNTDEDTAPADPMFERFKEMLAQIEATIPFDHSRLCLGGTSGGAYRAYLYAARIQRPWLGIFANGGWLGFEPFSAPSYPKGTRVAMVNGNNDEAANFYVDRDTRILQERGCEVGLFSFEGAHQVPPPETQVKALEWLLHLTDKVYPSPVTSAPAP